MAPCLHRPLPIQRPKPPSIASLVPDENSVGLGSLLSHHHAPCCRNNNNINLHALAPVLSQIFQKRPLHLAVACANLHGARALVINGGADVSAVDSVRTIAAAFLVAVTRRCLLPPRRPPSLHCIAALLRCVGGGVPQQQR